MYFFIPVYIILITLGLSTIGMGGLGTYILIPSTFFYLIFDRYYNKNNISKSQPVKFYIGFVIIGLLLAFKATNIEQAFDSQLKAVSVLLFALSIYSFIIQSVKNLNIVLLTNVFILLILVFYFLFSNITLGNDRVAGSALNSNSYGYIVFVGLSSVFLLYTLTNKNKWILYTIFFLVPTTIYIALTTSSRGGLITTLILIIGNIYLISIKRNKKKQNKHIRFYSLISIIIMGLVLNYFYDNIYLNSNINKRFDLLYLNESTREYHVQKAIEIGLENPILGIGAGNYSITPKLIEMGSFTHNAFAEAFVSYGIFGLLLYLLICFSILKKIFFYYKDKNIKKRVISHQILMSFIVFIIYNLLYVVYLSPIFMMMMMMMIALLHKLKTNKI